MVDLRELAFVLFEILTILAAVRAVRRFGLSDDAADGPPHAAILIAAGSLCASALLATLFSFLRLNYAASYLVGAVVLLLGVSAPRPSDLVDDLRWLWERWSALVRNPVAWATAAVAVVLLGPALLACMRPLVDGDSVLAMGSMLRWRANSAIPYDFAFYNAYPAVWELCFIPGLVVSASDQWLWWVGLKATFLLAAVTCAIGRRLGLSRGTSLTVTLSVVALRHLWWSEVCGTGTLKNDTVVGAGFLLVVLALLELVQDSEGGIQKRRTSRLRSAVLMVVGCIWLTAKLSGVAVAGPAAVLWLGFALWRRAMTPRAAAGWAAAGAAAWLVLCGHYYVHNLVVYHNPLYPAVISIGGHVIAPGALDLRGTSILSNIRDSRLPGILANAPAILGPSCWFMLIIGLLGAVGTIGQALLPARYRRWDFAAFVTSVFILGGWLWYPSLYFSAGMKLGDLQYTQNLNTVRYAIGPLALTEIWSAALLVRLTGYEAAGTAFGAFSLGGRWLVLWALVLEPTYGARRLAFTVLPAAAVLLIWAAARRVPLRAVPAVTVAATMAAALWGVPSVVEFRREQSWDRTGGGSAWRSWADRASSRVGVIGAGRGWAPLYRVVGRRFQHDAFVYPTLAHFERDPKPPELLCYVPHPADVFTPAGMAATVQAAGTMLQHGYTPIDFSLEHLLAERRATAPDAAIVGVVNLNGAEAVGGKRFWWLGAGTTRVFVWSRGQAVLQVTLQGSPGPNAGPGAAGRLRITDAAGVAQVVTVSRTPTVVRVSVPGGVSPIALDPLDMVLPVQSADVRPLVINLARLEVAVERDAAAQALAPVPAPPPVAAAATAAPCSFELTNGWYGTERSAEGWVRWSSRSGEIQIVSPGGGPVTLAGEFVSITRGNTVEVALGGRVVGTMATRAERFGFEPVGPMKLTLPPGGGRLVMTSKKAGVVIPPDRRLLGFALRNLTVMTGAGACAARF